MNKLITIISAVTGTAIIGGGGIYLLSTQNTEKIKNKFKYSLIKLNGDEDNLLKEKLKYLKDQSLEPNSPRLKLAKSKAKKTDGNGLTELKEACQAIYDSDFDNRISKIFNDFQFYCAKNIKDQITQSKWAVGTEPFEWKAKHITLKSKKEGLVSDLKAIANKLEIGDEDLKNWCKGIENALFEGEENMNYKNASDFCTK